MTDTPPTDHGSDRYDYVEVEAPPGIRPVGASFDRLIARPCADCRANVFATYLREAAEFVSYFDDLGQRWAITIAHDETCPRLRGGPSL